MYTGLPRTVLLVDPDHQGLCVPGIASQELQFRDEFVDLLDVCEGNAIRGACFVMPVKGTHRGRCVS